MTIATHPTDALRTQIAGSVLSPSDPAYDDARRVHNGLIDRRPALVVRCHGTADVQAAVLYGRERGLEIAVRGGGHNVAGNAVCDGGLMIDLSAMRGVHVDPRGHRARAQGGATWGDYNRETQLHGLASTGGVVSTTGVGGLTLGGGLGWLMGKHGLAVDCLRAVELVTSAGEVVRASVNEHPDLFWAVRGGGGNFGVATWLEYELHPVGPTVIGGLIAHPFSAARDVLRFYRDFTKSLPDELTAFAGLLHAPDGSGAKLAAIMVCHAGPPGDRRGGGDPPQALRVPRDGRDRPDAVYRGEHAVRRGVSPRRAELLEVQLPLDPQRRGHRHDDRALRRRPVADERAPARALPRRGHARGPDGHRLSPSAVGYNFLTVAEWVDASTTAVNVAWARDAYAAMAPHFAAGRYVNYLNADELREGGAVEAAFGPNWKRLREVKRGYDPDNVFHLNQNIKP